MPRADHLGAGSGHGDRRRRRQGSRSFTEVLRRLLLPVVLVTAVVSMSVTFDAAAAPAAYAVPTQDATTPPTTTGNAVCGNLPIISGACNELIAGASWMACPVGGADDCVTRLSNSVVSESFDFFAQWVAIGAVGAINMVWVEINATTTPRLDPSISVFATSMQVARALAIPLLILAALYSLMKRDGEIAVKAALFYLPGSVLFMVISGYLLNAALAVTDEVARTYVDTGNNGIATWLDSLSGAIGTGAGVTAPILLVIFSFVLIIGSVLVWLVMIVRSVAILVTYSFMPLALAAMIFPATRAWIRRIVEIQLAFILAKPVIIAIIALGATTMNDADNALVGMIQASALFYMASISPFALMKLLPFLADEAVNATLQHPQQTSSRFASTTMGVVTGQKLSGFLAGSQQGGPVVSGLASSETLASGSSAGGKLGNNATGGSSGAGGTAGPSSGGGIEGGSATPSTGGQDFT